VRRALAGGLMARVPHLDELVVTAIAACHDPEAEGSTETACVQLANSAMQMLARMDPDPPLLERRLVAPKW
jgi:hypothetical protein